MLSGALQVVFGLVALGSLAVGVAAIFTQSAFDNYVAPGGGLSELRAWDDLSVVLGVLGLVELPLRLALFVLAVVWTWMGHRAVAGLAQGQRKWSRGWAIGGWFIPFGSIVIPKLVLDENERLAKAATSGAPVVNWRTISTSTVGKLWWWLFIVSNVVSFQVGLSGGEVRIDPDPGSYRSYYVALYLSAFVATVSAVCGALYVQEIAARVGPRSPMFAPLPSGVAVPTAANRRELVTEVVAERVAQADVFCELCREPMRATATRCPRCGKPRKVDGRAKGARRGAGASARPPATPTGDPTPPPPPPPPSGAW